MKLNACLLLCLGVACGDGGDDAAPDAAPDAAVVLDAAVVPDADQSPTLTSVIPSMGIVGTTLTISGVDFGADQGTSTLSVDGVAAPVLTWSDTVITATLPDLYPGSRDVIVTVAASPSPPMGVRVILPAMVYINNDVNPNTLSAMRFDSTTSTLSRAGSPYSLGDDASSFGGCASSVIVHEGTRRVFASSDASVTVFNMHPTTGALTTVTGSPFASGGAASYGLASNAAGTRLFVANFDSENVSVFDIESGGALSAVPGSPFAAGGPSDMVRLSSDEAFLYVNNEDSTLAAFSIAGDGVLTALAGSPYANSGSAYMVYKRPGFDQLILPDGPDIAVYGYDPSSGLPSEIANSPFASGGPADLSGAAFSSDGDRLFVSEYDGTDLQVFDLAPDGSPTAVENSPFSIASGNDEVSCTHVTRDDVYLLILRESSSAIGVHALAADGTPTAVTDSPFSLGVQAQASGMAATF